MDEKQVALLSAGVSLLAAIVSAVFSLRALRAQAVANRVQATAVRNQYFGELREWAGEVCESLSGAIHLCELDPAKCQSPPFFDRRHEVLTRLSGLIDRGRFFFPNQKQAGVGDHKPEGFQGWRHEVLSSLVKVYRLVDRLDCRQKATEKGPRVELEAAKREFVSQVQAVLDPRGLEMEFRRLMGR